MHVCLILFDEVSNIFFINLNLGKITYNYITHIFQTDWCLFHHLCLRKKHEKSSWPMILLVGSMEVNCRDKTRDLDLKKVIFYVLSW